MALLILVVVLFVLCLVGLSRAEDFAALTMLSSDTTQAAHGFTGIESIWDFLGKDFWLALALTLIVTATVRKIFSHCEQMIIPSSTTNETVCVEFCKINEFWSKILLLTVTVGAIYLSRGIFGKELYGYYEITQIIFMLCGVLLIYFAKGQALTEYLIGKLLALANIGPLKDIDENCISEREYIKMGKTK